ncbi:hypothetical protein [Bradyrhizobium elkanii]|uniref:hypothetical protein n=1 Tax=Bradyrhizobium elkanii TaxID=29448 RepID=UPI0012BD11C0|nr:hypothetical protein [Bradyrhizobium elkanii]
MRSSNCLTNRESSNAIPNGAHCGMQHPERIYAAHDDGLPIVPLLFSRRVDQRSSAGTTGNGIIPSSTLIGVNAD